MSREGGATPVDSGLGPAGHDSTAWRSRPTGRRWRSAWSRARPRTSGSSSCRRAVLPDHLRGQHPLGCAGRPTAARCSTWRGSQAAGSAAATRADGTGTPRSPLLAAPWASARRSSSRDGRWLVLRRSVSEAGNGDIYASEAGDTTLVPLVTTPARELEPGALARRPLAGLRLERVGQARGLRPAVPGRGDRPSGRSPQRRVHPDVGPQRAGAVLPQRHARRWSP